MYQESIFAKSSSFTGKSLGRFFTSIRLLSEETTSVIFKTSEYPNEVARERASKTLAPFPIKFVINELSIEEKPKWVNVLFILCAISGAESIITPSKSKIIALIDKFIVLISHFLEYL